MTRCARMHKLGSADQPSLRSVGVAQDRRDFALGHRPGKNRAKRHKAFRRAALSSVSSVADALYNRLL